MKAERREKRQQDRIVWEPGLCHWSLLLCNGALSLSSMTGLLAMFRHDLHSPTLMNTCYVGVGV